MRETKFRGKTIQSKKWVYGYYFQTPLTDEETNSKPEDGWSFLSGRPRHCISKDNCVYEVNPETLGEYSGLKDKNDTEIYEYDLVKVDGFKLQYYKVEFIEGAFCLTNPAVKDYPLDINICYPSVGCQLEVVGNFVDNPELLEKRCTCHPHDLAYYGCRCH
jgi:uncharacterized phage protein (TIGR01671 family)